MKWCGQNFTLGYGHQESERYVKLLMGSAFVHYGVNHTNRRQKQFAKWIIGADWGKCLPKSRSNRSSFCIYGRTMFGSECRPSYSAMGPVPTTVLWDPTSTTVLWDPATTTVLLWDQSLPQCYGTSPYHSTMGPAPTTVLWGQPLPQCYKTSLYHSAMGPELVSPDWVQSSTSCSGTLQCSDACLDTHVITFHVAGC